MNIFNQNLYEEYFRHLRILVLKIFPNITLNTHKYASKEFNDYSNFRLVSLGESSHGVSEFFKNKSKISLKLLSLGYNKIYFEDSEIVIRKVNKIIQNGTNSSLKEIMKSLYKVWQVEEVLDFFEELRNLNTTLKKKIEIVGIDFSKEMKESFSAEEMLKLRDKCMAESILKSLKDEDKGIVWAHNFHIKTSKREGTMGYYLNKELGKEYFAIAQLFKIGTIRAENWEAKNSIRYMETGINYIPKDFIESSLGVQEISGKWSEMIKRINKNKIRNLGYYYKKGFEKSGEKVNEKSFDYFFFFETVKAASGLNQ